MLQRESSFRAGLSEKRSVSLALAFIAFHARAALAEPSASGTGETIRRKFYPGPVFLLNHENPQASARRAFLQVKISNNRSQKQKTRLPAA